MPAPDKREEFLVFISSAWKISKLYEQYFKSTVESYKITRNEKDVLLFLYNNPQYYTATDIVRYRSISKSLVSKSVESLLAKGYLAEEQARKDKRYTNLILTPRAIPLVTLLAKKQSDFFCHFLGGISQKEFAQYISIQQKIINNIEEGIEKNE